MTCCNTSPLWRANVPWPTYSAGREGRVPVWQKVYPWLNHIQYISFLLQSSLCTLFIFAAAILFGYPLCRLRSFKKKLDVVCGGVGGWWVGSNSKIPILPVLDNFELCTCHVTSLRRQYDARSKWLRSTKLTTVVFVCGVCEQSYRCRIGHIEIIKTAERQVARRRSFTNTTPTNGENNTAAGTTTHFNALFLFLNEKLFHDLFDLIFVFLKNMTKNQSINHS